MAEVTTTTNIGEDTAKYFYQTAKLKIRDLCWTGNTQDDAITKYMGQSATMALLSNGIP